MYPRVRYIYESNKSIRDATLGSSSIGTIEKDLAEWPIWPSSPLTVPHAADSMVQITTTH